MAQKELTRADPQTGRPGKGALELRTSFLAISLLSVFVIIASDWLINEFGWPSATDPLPASPAAGPAESTARVGIVTTLMLLIGACALGFSHFARQFRMLDGKSRIAVAATFGVLLLGVVIYFQGNKANPAVEAQELTGQALFCHAAGMSTEIDLVDNAQPAIHGGRSKPAASVPDNCQAPTYWQLRGMITVQQVALGLALPAMVLGAIITLARRSKDREEAQSDDPELLKHQIGELNTILYLSAFILVCGLLFISAYHHYPAYALDEAGAKAHKAHSNAIILFYGVSFSLLIMTYYLPTAGVLAQRAAAAPRDQDERLVAAGLLETTQLLKIGLALLAPVIASLLGEVIKIPGT